MYPSQVELISTDGETSAKNVRDYNGDVSNYNLIVGGGTTQPTIDDIDLESEITTSTLTKTALTWAASGVGNVVFTRSFTNITNENVTISELGLFAVDSLRSYLLAREVLSTPRTVAPNETVTFSFEIAFN
jgi:hypothetical protein